MLAQLIINTSTPVSFTVIVEDDEGTFFEVVNDDLVDPFKPKTGDDIPTDPDFDPTTAVCVFHIRSKDSLLRCSITLLTSW